MKPYDNILCQCHCTHCPECNSPRCVMLRSRKLWSRSRPLNIIRAFKKTQCVCNHYKTFSSCFLILSLLIWKHFRVYNSQWALSWCIKHVAKYSKTIWGTKYILNEMGGVVTNNVLINKLKPAGFWSELKYHSITDIYLSYLKVSESLT